VFGVRDRDVGLLIQAIEPNGRIHRDGRLRVDDHIVAINGVSLIGTDFYRLVPCTTAPFSLSTFYVVSASRSSDLY